MPKTPSALLRKSAPSKREPNNRFAKCDLDLSNLLFQHDENPFHARMEGVLHYAFSAAAIL